MSVAVRCDTSSSMAQNSRVVGLNPIVVRITTAFRPCDALFLLCDKRINCSSPTEIFQKSTVNSKSQTA